MKERKDIDKQYTWDLEVIYSSNKEFEDDYNKVREMIKELSNYENNMTVEENLHISETALDNYDNYDYKVKNNSTLEDLEEKAKEIISEGDLI